ncbi:MAG: FecR domain-containing protein [Gammaproteobacteria bacterium]|nr:FecR domain-containing protein [Gammaproteobacteria bacterium]MCP5140246.1 FecR domain-containing protein [Chromatiales bacterium]
MVRIRVSLLAVLVLSASVLVNPVWAQTVASGSRQCEAWVARLISSQGSLNLRRSGLARVSQPGLNEPLCVGDVLEVGPFSRAALELPDQTVVSVDQDTIVTFAAPADDKRTWLDILRGAIHVISRDPRALRVITPFANAGIEGTEFFVGVGGDATTVIVYEGRVKVENSAGAATAASGESVLARAGSAPVLQQIVRPRDAVVWTLYYPPTGTGPLPDAAAAEPAVPSVDFYVGRAEQRLAVGQVSAAEADLTSALSLAPGSAEVLARQSVIVLTRDDTEAAARLADQAVAAAPDSAAARLAQSYVRQARFDLPGAISDLEAGVAAHPDNALLRARLAELWLASGEFGRSEAEAKAALAADPQLSLAHAVLGFVELSHIRPGAARDSFVEAIRLEPNAPLPRLGLGLAKIRDGELEAGRKDIEIAVILDPNNSLVRSYMGKAYFDEKRDKLAASQFDIAKGLDPNDPTPWFYDAIRRQTVNDPVGAILGVQKSVELNDNRAVYRSRLELDQDLAARSAALGKIERNLGFEELALREGWQSIALAPADYSGHRLLADNYSFLPRHEIARVNELLQSQILQPQNMTPIQPQLAEANLFVLDNAGPTAIAFNEFNPLFSRDRLAIQASAVVGNQGTWGGDSVLSGIEGPWSFSVGGFHFETDGFQENNDLTVDTGNAFVQFQQSVDTSFFMEIRSTHREEGDLVLRFEPADNSSLPRQDEDSSSVKLGARHNFSNRSTLLALFAYQTASPSDFSRTSDYVFGIDSDAYVGELQWLYRADRWSLVTGARYYGADQTNDLMFVYPIPDPPFEETYSSTTTTRPENFSTYAYLSVELTPTLVGTLGLASDNISGSVYDRDEISPKFGAIWRPTADTTVRVGAFQTLNSPMPTRDDIQPSLEPTAVGGFNQFFAGVEAERDRRYGLGVDQRFGEYLFAGAEVSKRKIDLPIAIQTPPPEPGFSVVTTRVDESNARAYLYWIPSPNTSASLNYQYDLAEYDDNFAPYGFRTLETHRFPFNASYYAANGFSFGLTPTFVHQRGKFQDFNPPFDLSRDDDDFWVVDGYVQYRLPNRWGVVRLEGGNLFDSSFKFQDVDPENPRILPERLILLKLTVAM